VNDIVTIILLIIFVPFLSYTLFRIVSSAIFRSWFESKREFEKKEDKDGRKDTP